MTGPSAGSEVVQGVGSDAQPLPGLPAPQYKGGMRLRLGRPFVLLVLTACGGSHVPLGRIAATHAATAPITAVRVDNRVGTIALVASTTGQLDVQGEVRIRESRLGEQKARGALAFGEHVTVTQQGGTVTIVDAHAAAADHDDWRVDLTVAVPGAPDVAAKLVVGDLSLRLPTAAEVNLAVEVGRIDAELDGIGRRLEVSATTGDVAIAVRRQAPSSGATLSTVTGRMSLALPPDVAGKFDLEVAVGGLRVDPRYGLEVVRDTVGARVAGTVAGGTAPYSLNVTTGDLELR